MFWENPSWLLALWLLPFVIGLFVSAGRGRQRAAARFIETVLQSKLFPDSSPTRGILKTSAVIAGIALLIAAAARPRWGAYFETVQVRGVDAFVVLDVSRSMLAEDVAPNRLARAKSDIHDLMRKLPGDRVGLIVFAGAAVVKVPLTHDHRFLVNILDEVDPGSAPKGGSLIGDAIRKAIESMGPHRDRDQIIVLITDGEDHDSFPLQAAQQAAERGIKVFTVGLGDPGEGRRIPVRDQQGKLTYLQHEGQEVWSKMDERTLKEIALKTGGAYVPAKTTAYDLGEVYEERLAKLTRGDLGSQQRKRYGERFQIFVVIGLGLLVFDMFLPRHAKPRRIGHGLLPVLFFVAFLLELTSSATIAATPDAARQLNTGVAQHKAKDFVAAEKSFAAAAKSLPDVPLVDYDRACALAAQGKFDEAEKLFQQAKLSPQRELATASVYNLGCVASSKAKAKFGEKPEEATAEIRKEGVELLNQAIAYYRDCLELAPEHVGARHNLEVLRLWLKNMSDVWRRRDRDKRREEMGLLEFLEFIQQEQTSLRQMAVALQHEPDSPRRRQQSTLVGHSQRELSEEIEPLQKKIRASLQPPADPTSKQTQTSQPTAPDPNLEQAIEQLLQTAQAARNDMSKAAIDLGTNVLESAAESQFSALEKLDEIYRAVAPFEHLLGKSITAEERQISSTSSIVNGSPARAAGPAKRDLAFLASEQSRDQHRIAGWVETLTQKADHQLKSMPKDTPPAPDKTQPPDKSTRITGPDPQTLEQMKATYQKATELGPRALAEATAGADHLAKQEWNEALPRQEEALKLLKEISDSLPKQPQQQNDQQNNDQQNQPDKSNQQQDQSNARQQDKQQPQKKDEESSSDEHGKKDKSPSEAQADPSRERAEAMLRKVREREKEYKERGKEIQALIRGRIPVDKDW